MAKEDNESLSPLPSKQHFSLSSPLFEPNPVLRSSLAMPQEGKEEKYHSSDGPILHGVQKIEQPVRDSRLSWIPEIGLKFHCKEMGKRNIFDKINDYYALGFDTSPHRIFSAAIRRHQLLAHWGCSAPAGGSRVPPSGNVPQLVRFVLDSGAAFHAVGEARVLRDIRLLPPGNYATLPDGSRLCIVGIGTLQCESFSVPDVHLIRGLRTNLISVGQLDRKHGLGCSFHSKQCQVIQADGTVVGGAILEDDGMYELRFLEVPEECQEAGAGSTSC